jgi:hypothetical protein
MPCIDCLWREETTQRRTPGAAGDQQALLRQQLSLTVEELQVMEEELQGAHHALAAMQSLQAAAAVALHYCSRILQAQVHQVRADAAAARRRYANCKRIAEAARHSAGAHRSFAAAATQRNAARQISC